MEPVKLQSGMGASVIRHLSQFVDLPATGIVAGQAVASAVQDLYQGGLGGVYNDVDVFRPLRGARALERKDSAHKTLRVTSGDIVGQDLNGYGSFNAYLSRIARYRISSVSSSGLLNYVNCTAYSQAHPVTAHDIIDTFDMNCTRVAVDLRTQSLVWDPHFERFLASRQLEIVAMHTPWHTLTRFLKKLTELREVYADVPTTLEFVAAFVASKHIYQFTAAGQLARRFGEKAYGMAERTRSSWDTALDLKPTAYTSEGGYQLYEFVSRGEPEKAMVEAISKLYGAALHYSAARVYEQRKTVSAKTLRKQQDFQGWTQAKNATFCNLMFEVRGNEYLQGQVTQRHIAEVNSLFKQHPFLTQRFSRLTLDEQFHMTRWLRAQARERGEWVYGVAETSNLPLWADRKELMRAEFDEAYRRLHEPFEVEPLNLTPILMRLKLSGTVVEELLRPLQLKEEGESLGHCVGGYANKVRTNSSRIIRIRTGEGDRRNWSTLEVISAGRDTLGPTARLKLVQHYSVSNSRPSALHQEIAQLLIAGHGLSRLGWVLVDLGGKLKGLRSFVARFDAYLERVFSLSSALEDLQQRSKELPDQATPMPEDFSALPF